MSISGVRFQMMGHPSIVSNHNGQLAQLVEQGTENPCVLGSIPRLATTSSPSTAPLILMKIHSFQHVPFESLGMIEHWAKSRQHTLTHTLFHTPNHLIPSIDDYDALIIMGGSMGINDTEQYSWLEDEIAHIKIAIAHNKPILGICLGAQLIAHTLGATISKNPQKEIGWFPINFTPDSHPITQKLPSTTHVLHWHGDTFSLPPNATHLASSPACANQAFIFNNIIGLQFHLEMDETYLPPLLNACKNELVPAPFIQDATTISKKSQLHNTGETLNTLLDHWITL